MTISTAVPLYREVLESPRRIRLNPHWGQMRVLDSKAREILCLAGTQSGKTSMAVDWLFREIGLRGEGDYFMVTASFPLLQLKLLPEFLGVFRDILHLGTWREADKVFEYANGKTRVIFGTAQNPESLESATAKGAVADEAGQNQFRREAREALLRRLAIHKGRILYATTPYTLGWLKGELYDRAKEPGSDIEVISFPSTANPAFPKEEAVRAKRALPPWKYRMFYEGSFERPVGLVYDSFDEARQKIPRFPLPPEWSRYTGHDFGTSNPACMFYARVESAPPAGAPPYLRIGDIIAYDEYKPGQGLSTTEHVLEFKRRTQGLTVKARVGGSHQEEGWRGDFRGQGWPISEPPINRVDEQIARVYALHKLQKLYAFSDLQAYLDEKMRFSYVLDADYGATDKLDDEPSFHLLSSERYIMSLSDFTPERMGGSSRTMVITSY